MTLQEAWYNIIGMDNSERMSSSQIFSILCDYGVFVTFPKLRIAVKTALNYGLWDLVSSKNTNAQISQLRFKLENDGFADSVIDSIILSFTNNETEAISKKEASEGYYRNDSNATPSKFTESALPFRIEKAIDVNITELPTTDKDEIIELNKKLFIVPEWDLENKVVINELNISDKEIINSDPLLSSAYSLLGRRNDPKRYCLSFDITSDINRHQTNNIFSSIVRFFIFVIARGGRIHSKNWVTSINLKDKYAISSGDYELALDLPVKEIDALVLVPETGDLDIPNVDPNYRVSILDKRIARRYRDFKLITCPIIYETISNIYSRLDIELSDFKVWGFDHSMSLSFLIKGHANSQSGYSLGNNYIVAIFNQNNKLVDTLHIFIGKTGYIGPRGGLHDTFMSGGEIHSEYFMYFDIKINTAEIGKIIISPSN